MAMAPDRPADHPAQGFLEPSTLDAAMQALRAPGAVAFAGGTWIMRAPLRHQETPETFVSLSRLNGFADLSVTAQTLRLGAGLTHEGLATSLPRTPALHGLITAAGKAANPGIRRLATLGGNLCTADFAASDLGPALLALEAEVCLHTAHGPETRTLEALLAARRSLPKPWLLLGVTIPRTDRLSAHERLPMRKAGDYPVAIVSLSAAVGPSGLLHNARIAVGAVEDTPRRWPALETAVEGLPPDPDRLADLARSLTHGFTPRDGIDAPGWYSRSVLPALVRRAFQTLGSHFHAG